MKTLPKVVKTNAVVRFQDCDPFNHLNNGKYLDYFMNAREDQVLKNYNLDIYEYAKKTGNSWVVGSHQISYLQPAVLMEKITIDSQLINYTDKKLHVELRMWNNDQSQLKAIMWSTFIHYSLQTNKSITHNAELTALFEAIKNPISAARFENRIEEIRK